MSTPLKVLFVEDRASDAELMLHELSRTGYDAVWRRVETEEDYLGSLDASLDVILADYNLPQFDAMLALDLLQAGAFDIPFIVVTGSISEEVAVECIKHGAADYLLKDRLTRLGSAVARALEQKRLRRAKREAEAALRKSEQGFRLLAENATDMISRQTADGIYLYVSPACRTLLGHAPEELLGRSARDFAHVEDLAQLSAAAAESDPAAASTITYRARRKDGRYVWFETTSRPIVLDGRVLEVDAVARDITERKRGEEQIKASLKEKEVLLREIYHRVKNNLQLISSLLNLQAGYVKDKQALESFKECQNRVRSMALIHDKLYQSKSLMKINCGELTRSLVDNLFYSYGVNPDVITHKVNVTDVVLGVDTAIPCGLLINELVSNSLKHAFPPGKGGEIAVDFRRAEDKRFTLTVSDNGVGLPHGINVKKSESLGMQIVSALADQLGASLEIRNGQGTMFRLTFEELHYRERG